MALVAAAVVAELLVAAADDNSLIDRALVVAVVVGLGCWWELVDSILFRVLAFVALVGDVSWIH